MPDSKLIADIAELKTDIKYISLTLWKMELVFEQNTQLQTDQKNMYKLIGKCEDARLKLEERMSNVEKWKVQVITLASIIATAIWFLLNKLF